jgi:hypothetical protein
MRAGLLSADVPEGRATAAARFMAAGEESPGSSEERCRVTPGGSAQVGLGTVPQKSYPRISMRKGRNGAVRAHRGGGNIAGKANPTGSKIE